MFDGGVYQQLGANSSEERDSWLQALQLASYDCMRSQLLALRQRMEATSGHKHDTDIQMLRLKRGITTGSSCHVSEKMNSLCARVYAVCVNVTRRMPNQTYSRVISGSVCEF